MIPRIAHYIWFGSALPYWAQHNIDAFCDLHPDWEIKIWTDTTPWRDEVPKALWKVVDSLPWFSSRSDIVSYCLLKKFGGVYLDCDIVPLRAMDELLDCPAFAGVQPDKRINCAVVGSESESEAMNRIVDAVKATRVGEAGVTQIRRTTYGPNLLTRLFKDKQDILCVLPRHYFYPIPSRAAAAPILICKTHKERLQFAMRFCRDFTDRELPYAAHLWGVDGSTNREAVTGHADELSGRLLEKFGDANPIRGAEVGVLHGKTSAVLLQRLPNLFLYLADPWIKYDCVVVGQRKVFGKRFMNDAYVQAVTRTHFAKDRRGVMRMTSRLAVRSIIAESLDFVFIDADHRYESVLADLALWADKVRPGGLICGHDIDNPVGAGDWGVRQAVQEFFPDQPIEASLNFCWYIDKLEKPAAEDASSQPKAPD